ncbi:MAG: DNA mismatch repair endonuclease MutL [Armatimonadia bacterium]
MVYNTAWSRAFALVEITAARSALPGTYSIIMPRIHVLTEQLANRIAAGEVVERPASVVKELVENSIDAGARRVEVELVEGGKRLIRVRDDGCGMPAEDALLAVQRFATSKISQAEDLEAILTMGFRGEALPSVAAVSHFRLQTREPASAEGAEVVVHGGSEPELKPVGCPSGTMVEVADLFFNTPARLKFLSATNRERAHCADWLTRLALSRPDLAFKLTHDGDVIFNTSGSGDLRSVLAAAYGSAAAREFLEVHAEQDDLLIEGLISGPKLLRATREHQLFFVNRRFVRSRQMGHALNEAYGLLLPAGRNPLCALHLVLPPEKVDPNVHPTKIEVRFRRGGEVHELVQQAAEKALSDAGFRSLTQAARHVERPPDEPFTSEGLQSPRTADVAGRFAPVGFEQTLRARRLRVNPFADRIDERDEGLEVHAEPVTPLPVSAPTDALPVELAPEPVRVLGQLADRYIVACTSETLLLLDQHRAAERVLLERLEDTKLSRQLLMIPETLELSAGEAAVARESLEVLGEMGYDLEEFGANSLLVRSVPAAAVSQSPVAILRAVIGDLTEWDAPSSAERLREKARASLACHAATKAGQHMELAEMQRLVDDLLASDSPAICPHGDPIIVSYDLRRIDRQFSR